MKRRELLVGTSAAAGGTLAASGPVAAQDGVDYGGWFDDVSNFDGTVDRTGQSEVSVAVGAEGNNGFFAFGPPAVRVDPGTTVVWEWTGEGGQHNVVHEGGDAFESELLAAEGATYEHTFEEEGVYKYYCQPHLGLGMKGAVVAGQPQQGGGEAPAGGGGETDPEEMGVPFQAHFVGVATILGMIVSLVFAFFVLKYGESPHASSPERK